MCQLVSKRETLEEDLSSWSSLGEISRGALDDMALELIVDRLSSLRPEKSKA